MSVSSVSGYSSTLWEEYLEQLKKKQQQGNSETVSKSFPTDAKTSQSGLSPDKIISELQSLQDDPEKLKARAAELAVEAASEAGDSVGIRARMLEELASDLAITAESGDLSPLQEKLAREPGGTRPMGPGPGGAAGVSSKLMEALMEEEEDGEEDTSSTLESIKALLAEIQALIEKEESSNSSAQTASGLTPEQILSELESLRDDPEKLKTRASELASQLKSEADTADGARAKMIEALAEDIEEVAHSGDLSSLEEKIGRGRRGARPASELQNEASAGFGALVSKFQAIAKTGAAETSDASKTEGDDAGFADIEASIDVLISKLKSNLTDQLRALYAQGQTSASSVSLSG
ncbi:MAG: hypothetical protein LBQ19_01740 [Synergistaceae bacterium]|nr:hypothetical protein [Synergistaceae bacterium]